jgi:hypothetical protein
VLPTRGGFRIWKPLFFLPYPSCVPKPGSETERRTQTVDRGPRRVVAGVAVSLALWGMDCDWPAADAKVVDLTEKNE